MTRAMKSATVSVAIAAILISCSGDSTKGKIETEKLQPVEVFIQGVGMDVERLAFNADGSHFVTSGRNGTTVWDTRAGKAIKTVFAKEAFSLASSRSGRYLITFSPSDQGKIHISDFAESTVRSLQVIPVERLTGSAWIGGISIADDEKLFALEVDEKIQVYDLGTLEQVREIPLKENHYLASYRKPGLTFLPGTDDLLVLSYDITVNEPDVLDEQRVSRYSVNIYDGESADLRFDYVFNSLYVFSWAISGDGKTLALLFQNKQTRTVDLTTGAKKEYSIAEGDGVRAIGFAGRNTLVFAGGNGIVGTLDMGTGRTATIDARLWSSFRAPNCLDVAVSNDGNTIGFANGGGSVVLYDVASNKTTVLRDPADEVLGLYCDDDASFNVITAGKVSTQRGFNSVARETKAKVITGSGSDQMLMQDPRTGGVDMFDVSIGRVVASARSADQTKWFAWFSRDGKLVFYRKNAEQEKERDDNLHVAHLDDPGRPPVRLENTDNGMTIRVFDDNRKALIGGFAAEYLGIWDLQTGRLLDTLAEQSGNARIFEFIDQQKCLIGARGNPTLYDLSTRTVLRKFTPTGYNGDERDIEKIAFSPDRKYFATGDAWGLVTIWDMAKEHEVLSFQAHKDRITSLTFSRDGRQIVSGSYSGKNTVVSDVATGRQLVQYVAFTDGEWIMITPEGYFTASPNGARYLNVRIGSSVYSIDNFYERFYNPSYVGSVLGGQGEPLTAAADIRKGFTLPPTVTIASPAPNAAFTAEELTVTVGATDMGGGIDEIRLYQNGKVVSEEQRGMKAVGATAAVTPKSAASGGTAKSWDATTSYDVTLLPGANVFRAVAFNRERTESNPAEITVHLKAASAASDLYVFVVGINEYKNPKYNLNYGRSDATAFGNAVAGRSRSIFRNVVRYQLYDVEAVRPSIEATFRKIKEQARSQDTFLFYYAGHGVMSEGSRSVPADFYLIPSDVTQLYGNDDLLASKAVSAAQLKEFCTAIRAQKQLVILDACQSGGAVASFATRGAAEERAITQLARSTGTVLLASTGTEQFATEFSVLSHGVFTYALLQGINGEADGGNPKDGKVTVKELEAYLNDRVPELTKKYRGTAQYPNSYTRGQDFPVGVR